MAFQPNYIPSIQLWLVAGVGMFDAVSGGSPVAANGIVARWEDQSGLGKHATQSTSAQRPTYKTAIVNGQPVLRFDETAPNYMSLPDFISGSTAGTVFVVTKKSNYTGANLGSPIGRWGSAVVNDHYGFFGNEIYDGWGSDTRKATGVPSVALNTWNIYSILSKAGEWTSRFNGITHYTTATNTVGWSILPEISRSNYDNANYIYGGDIAEIVAFSSALSVADRQKVEGYLANKYGLQSLLDGAHPYKSIAPNTGPFVLTDIPNLLAEFDATKGAYSSRVGGSLVTTDGADVNRWEDQSGNGYHAVTTDAYPSSAPTLKLNIGNGQKGIKFFEVSKLEISGFPYLGGNPIGIAVRIRPFGSGGGFTNMHYGGFFVSDGSGLTGSGSGNQIGMLTSNNQNGKSTVALAQDASTSYNVTADYTLGRGGGPIPDWRVFVDGTNVTVGAADGGWGTAGTRIGCGYSASSPDSYIQNLIVYNSALSIPAMRAIEDYMTGSAPVATIKNVFRGKSLHPKRLMSKVLR